MNTFQTNSANSNNATLLRAGPATLGNITVFNAGGAAAYLKLYNKNSAPVPGTDTPYIVLAIPAAGSAQFLWGDQSFSPRMQNGLGIGIVTGAADSDNTAVAANQVKVMITYWPN